MVAFFVKPFLWLTTRRDWSGVEHLPESGGFIAAANHMTNIDPLTTAHYLYDSGVAPKILAKSSLFRVPVVGAALRRTGQIPVFRHSRTAGDSLDAARESLAAGECVAIFPEGTLTRDPDLWPMVARTGVARLALTSRAPVVPIAQWGAQRLLGRYSKLLKPFPRKLVHVRAGEPVELADLYGRTDTAALTEATSRVMAAITTMVADLRGETPPAEVYDMRKHGPGKGPGVARMKDARGDVDSAAGAAEPDPER